MDFRGPGSSGPGPGSDRQQMESVKKGKTSVLPSKNCFAILVGFPLHYEHFPIR